MHIHQLIVSLRKQKVIKEYSDWLFDILFELHFKLNYKDYTFQQKRACGFIGELLLNVWTIKNKYKIKYVPVHVFPIGNTKIDFLKRLDSVLDLYSFIKKGKKYEAD